MVPRRLAPLLPLLLLFQVACPQAPADDDTSVPPLPPGAAEIAIFPASPTSSDDFMVQVVSPPSDPDGDLVGLRFAWSVDGVPRPDLVAPAVASDLTSRGEVWQVTGVPFDEAGLEGPPCTAEAVVGNSPPSSPALAISPDDPVGGQDALVCVVLHDPVDADGDEVALSFAWDAGGEQYPRIGDVGPADTANAGDTVPAEDTGALQDWTCTVTPADPIEQGEPGTATVSTAPPPPALDWELPDVNPASPTSGLAVSPRDYLEKVSGWAFLHAT